VAGVTTAGARGFFPTGAFLNKEITNMLQRIKLAAVVVLAALSQACTGGQLVDATGSPVKNSNGTYNVTFQNVDTGASYTTVVDNQGYFTFDGYAPASPTNNAVMVPEGNYVVNVQNGKFFNLNSFHHAYNNPSCSDWYNNNTKEPCAIYQLKIVSPGQSVSAPYTQSAYGYTYTVIPLGSWHFG
jgi:hypothetical protein